MSFAKPGTKPPKPVPIRGRGAARRKPSKEDEVSERERRYLEELGAIFKKNDEIPHDADADASALSSSPIDAGKEVDRNTAYLQREKDALDVLQRERSANSPVPKSRPTPPGAYPNATEDANHVVVDPAQIPGLGGGGHGERRHFASPNDGGIRAYPSWDDNVGGYTIPAGGVAKMAALSEEMDHLDAAEYERLAGGVETLAPDHAVHAAADAHARRPLAPSPGAFPGHLPENPDYFNDRSHPAKAARSGVLLRRGGGPRGVLQGPARRRGGAHQAGEARQTPRRARRAGEAQEGARTSD